MMVLKSRYFKVFLKVEIFGIFALKKFKMVLCLKYELKN